MTYKINIVVGASSFATACQEPLELLYRYGCKVTLNPFGRKLSEEETIDFLQGADGILAGLEPLNRRVLHLCCKNLKAVSRIGIGLDNVDLLAAEEYGIKVSNTPEGPTQAVAEMTVAALMAICRRLIATDRKMHACQWEKSLGRSIQGMSILVVGYGRIGRQVSKLLEAFGANVLVYDPEGAPEISLNRLDEGLKQAEVVSLHANSPVELLGSQELGLMPKGSILLNAARGHLVNEDALYEALITDHISACWMDVFNEEPYRGKLCTCDNALLTPHISTYTDKCRKDMENQAVMNILRDIDAL